MAFPTNPSNGDEYNGYKYISSLDLWEMIEYRQINNNGLLGYWPFVNGSSSIPPQDGDVVIFDGTSGGWTANSHANLSIDNGISTYSTSNYDPNITKSGLSIIGSNSRYIRLRLRNKTGYSDNFQVFYSTSSHTFSEDFTKVLYTDTTNSWQLIEFDMWESKTSNSTSVESSLDVEAGKSSSDVRRSMVFSH